MFSLKTSAGGLGAREGRGPPRPKLKKKLKENSKELKNIVLIFFDRFRIKNEKKTRIM